jgi:hypothetical protein
VELRSFTAFVDDGHKRERASAIQARRQGRCIHGASLDGYSRCGLAQIHGSECDHDTDPRLSFFVGFILHRDADNHARVLARAFAHSRSTIRAFCISVSGRCMRLLAAA